MPTPALLQSRACSWIPANDGGSDLDGVFVEHGFAARGDLLQRVGYGRHGHGDVGRGNVQFHHDLHGYSGADGYLLRTGTKPGGGDAQEIVPVGNVVELKLPLFVGNRLTLSGGGRVLQRDLSG